MSGGGAEQLDLPVDNGVHTGIEEVKDAVASRGKLAVEIVRIVWRG